MLNSRAGSNLHIKTKSVESRLMYWYDHVSILQCPVHNSRVGTISSMEKRLHISQSKSVGDFQTSFNPPYEKALDENTWWFRKAAVNWLTDRLSTCGFSFLWADTEISRLSQGFRPENCSGETQREKVLKIAKYIREVAHLMDRLAPSY